MNSMCNSVCKWIETACPYGELVGRIGLAVVFLWAGIGKLGAAYVGTQGYMEVHNVPGLLLPLVIALEIGGAIALIIGWKTRWFALALAGFCVLAVLFFHLDINGSSMFKNLAIAGGLLVLCHAGAGRFSIDHRMRRNLP